MNENLSRATEQYIEFEDTEIHPISQLDAQIIDKIFESVRMLSNDTNFHDMLEQYKAVPDLTFLEALNVYCDSLNSTNKNKRKVIGEVGGEMLIITAIVSIKKFERYKDKTLRFSILLNEHESQVKDLLYQNKIIDFFSEEERTMALSKLKKQIQDYSNILFV